MIGEMFLLGYMTMQSLRGPYLSTCERPHHRNPERRYSPISQIAIKDNQDFDKFFQSLRERENVYKKNRHTRNFHF